MNISVVIFINFDFYEVILKQERQFPLFTVTKKAQASIQNGHPWVYAEEILSINKDYENGDLVDVVSEKGTYLGTGLVSNNSKIRVRILSSNANESFSEEFFRRRIKYAINYRLTIMRDDFSSCRIIFGEADGFPGLTIDKYNLILSFKVYLKCHLILDKSPGFISASIIFLSNS